MILVLAAVAASHSGIACAPLDAYSFYICSAFYSSLDCFNKRTVKFLGELQINSNCVSTNLTCLMSSEVLGDYRNLTVFMKAFLYWAPKMYAASISKILSPRAIKLVIAFSSMSARVSRKASTFHFW